LPEGLQRPIEGVLLRVGVEMQLRKVLKNRGHFPSDEAATKLIYLALRDITKKWKNPPVTWKLAAAQLAIRFGQRFFAVEI
jgi:transposase-like protein